MRLLRSSSEAEMIAEFLRQEYASAGRYGAQIQACLQAEGVGPDLITEADIADDVQNDARRRVFSRYRGYGTSQPSYFTDFPTNGVDWRWVALTPDELLGSKYIRYPFWSDLSGGSRSPREAAIRIREGRVPTAGTADGTREGFLALAQRLREGLRAPPLILVSADDGTTRVVLEGHSRLTGYALAPDTIPDEIEALLGLSPEIARWDEY